VIASLARDNACIFSRESVSLVSDISQPTAEEVKEGLIAYRIAAHAGDLVKIREKAIKWDMEISEARRTLNWEKQIALAINPEEAERIHTGREGQVEGNNVPCAMCGAACVYIMLPQQRKERPDNTDVNTNIMKRE
jgi:phosphomethylpyrimidine synthase